MKKIQKYSIGFLLSVFAAVNIFGFIFLAGPVKAQGTDSAALAQRQSLFTQDKTLDRITKMLTMSAMSALVNAVSYFTRKLAYDTANYLANGGKGQSALVFQDGMGKYLENEGLNAVGEAVGTFGTEFGVNLCQIPSPQFKASLQVGLSLSIPSIPAVGQPQPKCAFQELKDSWGNIGSILEERYGQGGSRLASELFIHSMNVTDSDFGIALSASAELQNIKAEAEAAAQLERLIGQGIKNVVSPISGNIVTPSALVREELSSLSAKEQAELTNAQIAGMYGSELSNLPYVAGSVFLNTMTSQLLKRVMTGLFSDKPDITGSSGLSSGVGSFFAATLQDNRRSAQRALSFLIAPTIIQSDNYNIVQELVAAQVIDSGFQQAINRGANSFQYLTIGEALEQNLLHANWPLIPPEHAWNSSADRDCYLKAYCFSNLQKMRKARILPLGFELAAAKSNPDTPWLLGDVVKGFNDCNQFNEADENHKFCHLIDPDWILKSPQARCQTEGVGPELIDSRTNTRKTECMDLQTCLSESADGTCNAWGYCTQEQNAWRLAGEECPSYYSTCTTYKNKSDGSSASYLARTVDFGECDAKSVGCSAYSAEKIDDVWQGALGVNGSLKAVGRNQMLYFNKNVETCSSGSEGCTVFYGAQRDPNTGLFNKNGSSYIRNSADLIYLQKAPDYLGCYDTNPVTATTIEWPATVSQVLNNLPTNTRCNDFTKACAPTEVGCDNFTSVASGESVSAIVSIANSCSGECVGYETFRQEATNFEGEKFPLYFVPTLGQACSSQSAGCDEFTNLGTSGIGGESLEYYNYTRRCESPSGDNGKVFFSWEGSAVEGYVLRNHTLAVIDASEAEYINGLGLTFGGADSAGSVFPAGSPSYSDNTFDSLRYNYDYCNEINYQILTNNIFDPNAASFDCRQFYDDRGNIYYRIFRNTVSVSDQCRSLRKTEPHFFVDENISDQASCLGPANGYWDGSSCRRCYGGGNYSGDTCIYQAIPSESSQCSARASGCRAYTGNTGNNLRPNVIFDTFEGEPIEELSNWSAGAISAEALQTSQHSLRLVNGVSTARTIPVGTISANSSLRAGASYELIFWARGASQNLQISFTQGGENRGIFTAVAVSIGNEWQEYHLGPAQFTGDGGQDVILSIQKISGANADYYLDNIRLTEIQDSIYLIKDSWKQLISFNGQNILADAPAACYSASDNPLGLLPGYALGCGAYTDERNNTYYITGFSSLCRQDAVGCQPVYDSNNTVGEILPKVYNAVCHGAVGECEITLGAETLGSCIVPPGYNKCYVDEITLPLDADGQYQLLDGLAGDQIDLSTIYIPPESGDPIYLTNREEYQCPKNDIGCVLLGAETQTAPGQNQSSFEYADTYIINNPADYENVLCRQDLIGCNEYAVDSNTFYFKDPVETGHKACVYKESVGEYYGWFKDGIGECSDTGDYCQVGSDCASGSCLNVGAIPCYDDYLQNGDFYNVWSNNSTAYQGFVGVCQPRYGGCTELVDPQDTSGLNPFGRSYYRIYDKELTDLVDECNGQASLKEGCVLFNKTDQPNKFYNTQLTYALSDNTDPKYGLVNPVSSSDADNPDNANIILKVSRDRACSEWLSCSDKVIQIDDSGHKQFLCSKYKACNQFREGQAGEGCSNYVPVAYGNTFLDEEGYVGRDVSWYGKDYSGYSLLNKHQISSYGYFTLAGYEDFQFLGAEIPVPSYAVDNCEPRGTENTNGLACGPTHEGRCFAQKCIYTIDGSPFHLYETPADDSSEEKERVAMKELSQRLLEASCKIYPEEDGSFPNSVADSAASGVQTTGSHKKTNADYEPDNKSRIEFTVSNDAFKEVNICQDEENCSCEYNKYVYGAFVDYYSTTSSAQEAAPGGVCTGGDKDGEPCARDLDCQVKEGGDIISAGSCSRLKEIQTRLGLRGFCLEPDYSRPINGRASFPNPQEYACQTWLPIQTSPSNKDLFNLHTSAGYDPDIDANPKVESGELYCASIFRGGVIDKKNESDLGEIGEDFLNRIQDEIDGGNFDNDLVDDWFDAPIWYPNCSTSEIFNDLPNGLLLSQTISDILSVVNVQGTPYYNLVCSVMDGFRIVSSRPNDPLQTVVEKAAKKQVIENWKPFVYKLLTSFAWNRIGNNSVLLRAEYHQNKDLNMDNGTPDTSDDVPRFAPWVGGEINEEDPLENDWEIAHHAFDTYTHNNSIATDPTLYGGLYNFDMARHVVNEDSVKDFYFIPVLYKGSLRGAVPKTINDLANSNVPDEVDEWNQEVLRLPIKELKSEKGIANGSIVPIRGAHIDYHYGKSDGIQRYSRFFSFSVTGGVNGRSVNEMGKYQVGFGVSETDFAQNPLLMWRYKVENDGNNDLFFESGVQTKYVLVFFANDTKIYYPHIGGAVYNFDTDAPSFIGNHLKSSFGVPEPFVPRSALDDPFNGSVGCQRGYVEGWGAGAGGTGYLNQEKPHYGPWWAVAVNFSASGKFMGYTTRWCRGFTSEETGDDDENTSHPDENENAALGAGISFAVIADLANQCSEIVQVYDREKIANAETSNKAWTNRVWNGAINSDGAPLRFPFQLYGSIINRQIAQAPFASMRLSGQFMNDLTNPELVEYSFEDRKTDGIPYSCNYNLSLHYVGSVINNNNTNDPEKCAFSKNSNYRDNTGSGLLAYEGNEVMAVLRNNSFDNAYNAINELFALQFRRANLNPGTTALGYTPGLNYVDSSLTSDLMDKSDDIYGKTSINISELQWNEATDSYDTRVVVGKSEYLTPPSVLSINPLQCPQDSSGSSGVPCVAGDYDNLTVSNRNGVVKNYDNEPGLTIEELEQDDDFIAEGSFTANVRFFAFADDNRMPIRKVSVNWGDNNISNKDKYGYYKNAKPFCSFEPNGFEVIPLCLRQFEGELIPSGLTCSQDFHCPTELTLQETPGGSIYFADSACISAETLRTEYINVGFDTPRFGNAPRACTTAPFEFEHEYLCNNEMAGNMGVRISDLSDDAKGRLSEIYSTTINGGTYVCVFKPRVQVIDNWGYCNGVCSGGEGGNYCYTSTPESSSDECEWPENGDFDGADNKPWTTYKGSIIIVPEDR